ncbi:PREDICTED: lysM domain receptor-like kinase 3 [Theobroma cacao]|uniref:LysM domain receptor-like kinase 3 n=1 Tax=Theobroma cacao TaxID=3641 RepID=A0AB32UNG8_THECC|nr:PREDICTED: lysM domain receptor-like kinase 3 [Theobroma cacao]
MCFEDLGSLEKLVGVIILAWLSCTSHSLHVTPISCNVSLTESCPASLYYVPRTTISLEELSALFHVNSNAVNRTIDGFLIAINCSCLAGHDEFTWHLEYEVQPEDTWDGISSKFGSFVVEKPEKALVPSQTVTLDILCGCSEGADTVTYKVTKGDTLHTICSRFDADLNKTAWLNRLENPKLIHEGDVIFIPEPEGLQNLIVYDNKDSSIKKASKSQTHVVVGAISAAFAVILLTVILVSWKGYKKKGTQLPKPCSRKMDQLHSYFDLCTFLTKSGESTVSSFNSDKAVVFPYYEVCDATSNFSMSLKIGQGSYGSVYLGKLKGADVAIKQMKNTKSKEFLSEINILCKVHHSNLIELIGYAAGGDSLFLVYEFAQNGALSDHLHGSTLRGYKPLSWIRRVQIALDAANGLEYIHKHTKPYYVHRDVKTSNILLDSNFRAKIADFGLVKLLDNSPEVGAVASRIVGTFGYLAPEYVRDGRVTTKIDIYALGVVLMELLTGQPALSRDASPGNNHYSEHRTVVDYMLSALTDIQKPMIELAKCIDPNLTRYHKDSVLQMALLSKDCVDDNWSQRPDMSEVVLRLSHIFMSSKEWEKQPCSHTESGELSVLCLLGPS